MKAGAAVRLGAVTMSFDEELPDNLEAGGRSQVDGVFVLALAAYNLIRLPKLLSAPT